MQLLIRRGQRSSMLGKVTFMLDVRADISEDERQNIRTYKLGDTMLYQSHDIVGGHGLLGIASRLAWKAITINVSVNDLAHGKHIEVKDILEMLAVEDQIKEAATTFKAVLDAAAGFDGEEIIEL